MYPGVFDCIVSTIRMYASLPGRLSFCKLLIITDRADSRFAPSQRQTVLLCNDLSHWLGANLESALTFTAIELTFYMMHYWYRSIHFMYILVVAPSCSKKPVGQTRKHIGWNQTIHCYCTGPVYALVSIQTYEPARSARNYRHTNIKTHHMSWEISANMRLWMLLNFFQCVS